MRSIRAEFSLGATVCWATLGVLLVACDGSVGNGSEGGGGAAAGIVTSGPSTGPGGPAGPGGTGGDGSGAGATSGSTASGPTTTGAGAGTSLGNCQVFPPDNPWNTDISGYEVHPESDTWVDSIGRGDTFHADFGTEYEGAPIGLEFVVVGAGQPLVPVEFVDYPEESDPGPYPIPPDAPVEGGPDADGDRHVLVVDGDACMLYELFYAFPVDGGASWEAASGAVFDLSINDQHPLGYTSADAAGLPIFPGLVRYDEVAAGEVTHAIRFTASDTQNAFVPPARHHAGDEDPSLPPMGLRLRMKADYDCAGYTAEVQVLCTAFKRYGIILADNGSSWYLTGAHDPRWNDDALRDLGDIPGDAFEAVYTGELDYTGG